MPLEKFLFIVRASDGSAIYSVEIPLSSSESLFNKAHAVMAAATINNRKIASESCEIWQRTGLNHMDLLVTAF